MPYSEQISKIRAFSEALSANEPQNTYNYDLHWFAKNQFCNLPRSEKITKSTAAAIKNQKIYIYSLENKRFEQISTNEFLDKMENGLSSNENLPKFRRQ